VPAAGETDPTHRIAVCLSELCSILRANAGLMAVGGLLVFQHPQDQGGVMNMKGRGFVIL